MAEVDYSALTTPELIEYWNNITDMDERDRLMEVMQSRKLFPTRYPDFQNPRRAQELFPEQFTTNWERGSGAYPDIKDPRFIEKLLRRREFADSYQDDWLVLSKRGKAIMGQLREKYQDFNGTNAQLVEHLNEQIASGAISSNETIKQVKELEADNPCIADTEEFNISSVQRFVANFMSPRTPYRSALLYHGTGVGKTCSAIQIAEQWLHFYPNKKVIIIAPPSVQSGIIGNIFDKTKVKLGEGDNEPNSAIQCTGNYYMEATGTMFERNLDKIESKVRYLIGRRYEIYGYGKFANVISKLLEQVPARFTGDERRKRERRLINDRFGGRLIIVDEVHNLRDAPVNPQDAEAEGAQPAQPMKEESEAKDEAEGKILTPLIRKVLEHSDDIKFVTMTATPMYNSYDEIIFLFNLLLLNEGRPELRVPDIFEPNGRFRQRTSATRRDGGADLLGQIAACYVSYMRGENPITFPLRLRPTGVPTLTSYPHYSPTSEEINERPEFIDQLPIVPVEFTGDSLAAQLEFIEQLPQEGQGLGSFKINPMVQAGTCIVPPAGNASLRSRSSDKALGLHFHKQMVGGEVVYKARQAGGAAWLAADALTPYAPKIAAAIERIATAAGVCFIYTRFVQMGAIPTALALEANGYTPYGRTMGYLSDGIQVEGGRKCALCPQHEEGHEDHDFEPAEFVPAKYILLTGDTTLTPKKDAHIKAEKLAANKDGGLIKVVVGSSVASEGVDMKFIREIHILDGWYHLNKIEQIVGRGIRTCSHALLPKAQRNCTVYMYTGVLPEEEDRETADLYSYRMAYLKGRLMGQVSRVLKINAIDCNLNYNAIVIETDDKRRIINAQGKKMRKRLADQPFTALCDWMETCDYTCKPVIPMKELIERGETSEISYDEYTSRWYDSELRRALREKFADQASYRKLDLLAAFNEYPDLAKAALFNSVIDNPTFVVNYKGRNGYIIERNDYYVFQPFEYSDLGIPIAIRAANVPVRQDSYGAAFFEAAAAQVGEEAAAPNAAAEAAPEEEEEGPEPSTLRRLLDAWRRWTIELGNQDTALPDDVVTWTIGDTKEIGRREERRKMLAWFATSMRNAGLNEARRAQMQQTLMEYFFDEELNQTERQAFFLTEELRPDGAIIAPEQFLREGRRQVFVYVDINTGQDMYMCADGQMCNESIKNHFKGTDPEDSEAEKKARNPAYGLKVDVSTTGPMYGFIVAKYGEAFVFKTNAPPAVGKKVTKGQECANVSNAADHRKKLIELGKIMQRALGTNFELTELTLTEGSRKLHNVNQICVLTDLFLRFMDIVRVNGKRWFYRPVASTVTGHLAARKK